MFFVFRQTVSGQPTQPYTFICFLSQKQHEIALRRLATNHNCILIRNARSDDRTGDFSHTHQCRQSDTHLLRVGAPKNKIISSSFVWFSRSLVCAFDNYFAFEMPVKSRRTELFWKCNELYSVLSVAAFARASTSFAKTRERPERIRIKIKKKHTHKHAHSTERRLLTPRNLKVKLNRMRKHSEKRINVLKIVLHSHTFFSNFKR